MTATVVISVFGLFHPTEIEVAPVGPASALTVVCAGRATKLEGSKSMRVEPGCEATGAFALSIPGKIRREFEGTLRIQPGLTALITMDLETAVASVAASELPADAPAAAFEAQAIAARSYYAAAPKGRHAHRAFCDTTHCQHIKGLLAPTHPARKAAEKTRGLVLDYEGRVVAAMYSGSCQGKRQAGVANRDGYPYFAVECAYCRRKPSANVGTHQRGLCQAGAMELARQGSDAQGILRHYYPGTTIRGPL